MSDASLSHNSSDIRKRVSFFIKPSASIPFHGNLIHTYFQSPMHFLTAQPLHRSALPLFCVCAPLLLFEKVTRL